jgi:tetratricopeptide (TPR) repeat protein/predicted MPP superfamily phosphohydrolase
MREVFVIMPFGSRRASDEHATGVIDFDVTYRSLIRPAAEQAGWVATRIDEISETGSIADQYLRKIFSSDLVLADISLPNGNVYYELGIRQAASPGGTLLIAHDGTRLPFDIAGQRVIFYRLEPGRLEEGIRRLIAALHSAENAPTSNPIRAFLETVGAASNPRVDAAAFERDFLARIERASTLDQLVAVWQWARLLSPLPARPLLLLARRLAEANDWDTSVAVLRAAVNVSPDDFETHRQLGWHLRNLGPAQDGEALVEFKAALQLNPNDPETLGMLGGLLKRQKNYADAAAMYARGARISPNSLYMLVNEAALAIMSQPRDPSEGVALYQKLWERIQNDPGLAGDAWGKLVCGEAAFAVGNIDAAREQFTAALRLAVSPNAYRSAADQLELLAKAGFKTADATALAALLRAEVAPATVQPVAAAVHVPDQALPVIVHLSDIHLGCRQRDGKPVEMHRFSDDGEWSKSLSRHLSTEFANTRRGHFKYEHDRLFVIVSGDLTYMASKPEFDRVATFLTELCEGLSVARERVFIVPGNHDVNWAAAKVDLSHRFDNYLSFLRKFYGKDVFTKRYPRLPTEQLVDEPRPKPSDIIATYTMPGMAIVGLNSCVYETDQDHYGFIGGAQLERVEELLDADTQGVNAIRVAVMHHHLHPFPEPLASSRAEEQAWQDLSTIRDAGLAEKRLERLGFDLVLHGHKHKAQLRETLVRGRNEAAVPSRLIVCGAGSSGVNASELGHNDSNHYEVIEILRVPRRSGAAFLTVEWRELALRNDAEWATTERWTVSG